MDVVLGVGVALDDVLDLEHAEAIDSKGRLFCVDQRAHATEEKVPLETPGTGSPGGGEHCEGGFRDFDLDLRGGWHGVSRGRQTEPMLPLVEMRKKGGSFAMSIWTLEAPVRVSSKSAKRSRST